VAARTAKLPHSANAATVQAALNALPSIGGAGGTVTVQKNGNVFVITFGGTLAAGNVPPLIASSSGGATVSVQTYR
jgi:hypothetical protein